MSTHVVIPDTQVRRSTSDHWVPLSHLPWIGTYIVEQFAGKPDVTIIHLGDHWDMPSLSKYDQGKRAMEGRRYDDDVEIGNAGFALLDYPLRAEEDRRRRNKDRLWNPRKVLLRGNHEYRIVRATEEDPKLHGKLSLDDLESPGWEVHEFLEPVWIDGIVYAHYFVNNANGRPVSGMVDTRIKTIGASFTQGHQQGLKMGMLETVGGRRRGLIAGSCLVPEHRVLTADLRYVPLGDIQVGDELVSFDETLEESHGRSRRYKKGVVQAVRHTPAETFRVTLESGKTFTATADHLWMTRAFGPAAGGGNSTYQWRTTANLRPGTVIPRLLDEWDPLTSHEAGYLAGMYDGEGCYYTRQTTSGYVGQLSLSQRPGPVLERTRDALASLLAVTGITDTNGRGVSTLRLRGGASQIAKALGSLRPTRLLPKFDPSHLGRLTSTVKDKVVSIEPAGVRTIVQIDIDAKTMIVEGYAHHNCYLHDEEYRGPQGRNEWRGIIICHEVHAGDYCLMEVSLDYLCRRYEGVNLEEFLR